VGEQRVNKNSNDDERSTVSVRRLATGLCTVWNNNPAAFRWWSGLVSQNFPWNLETFNVKRVQKQDEKEQ